LIHWRVDKGMPTLSVETSIVSYLRGRPSGQVVAAARQLLTQQWWAAERSNYELVTSQYVLVDYLLTWNCTHIANARILPKVFDVLDRAGLARPIICTPEELLNDDAEIS